MLPTRPAGPLRPSIPLLLLAALAALALPAAADARASLSLPILSGAAEADLRLQADALPGLAAPVALGGEGVLAHPVEVRVRGGELRLPLLGSSSEGQGAATAGATAAPGSAQPSPQAEAAAVGALAAAGALALKLEPVRRGLFLLALPLYSRLRRSELLENGVRERIYRAVEAHPGLSIIQACRAATVGWGTAVYHLQRLERDKLIVSRRDGQYRRFYVNGQVPEPRHEDPALRALQHPLALGIARFVLASPGAAQKDVCAALGISPPLASKWLGRLLAAGLLTSERSWRHVHYAPTPGLAAAIEAAQERPAQPEPALGAHAAPAEAPATA